MNSLSVSLGNLSETSWRPGLLRTNDEDTHRVGFIGNFLSAEEIHALKVVAQYEIFTLLGDDINI